MSAKTDRKELCERLNIDVRTLDRWRKLEGAPTNYDSAAWIAFQVANGLGRDPSKTKTQLQEDKLRREIKLADLRIARETGAMVGVDEMASYVARFSARLDQLLTQKLEVELPPRVQGKDIVAIRQESRAVHDEIREIYNGQLDAWKPAQN
jgi:hypothetical protein